MILLLTTNILSFCAMALDKHYARVHHYRISENTLMLLAILGPVGAYLGMMVCHHKTKHLKFSIGIPLILLIECLIYFYCI